MNYDTYKATQTDPDFYALPAACMLCGRESRKLEWVEAVKGEDEVAACPGCASDVCTAHDDAEAAGDVHLAGLADEDDDALVSDGPAWFDDYECDAAAEEE